MNKNGTPPPIQPSEYVEPTSIIQQVINEHTFDVKKQHIELKEIKKKHGVEVVVISPYSIKLPEELEVKIETKKKDD